MRSNRREDTDDEIPQLRRGIGLVGLTAYGVGTILGAGIYALIGQAAALVAALTGLSYAELATTFPMAGAEFEFVHRAFGSDRLAFLVGWTLALSCAASAGTVALGFAGYLHGLVGLPVPFTALAVVMGASAINFLGIRETTAINLAFTLIETGGLVAVIAIATRAHGIVGPSLPITNWPGVLEAAGFVFFAYLGFEDIANVAEETTAPERLIPKAIAISVALTAFLYVGVALAALELVSPEELVASSAPLAFAVAAVVGEPGRLALSTVALFAIANTVLLLLTAGSRMLLGMARARVLPAILANVDPTTRTPGRAILIQGLTAAALLPIGGIGVLGRLASWAALTAFIAVNAALLWLRRTKPNLPRPFHIPLSLGWLSLPALLGLLAALLASLRLAPEAIFIGAAVTVLGLPVYQLFHQEWSDRSTR